MHIHDKILSKYFLADDYYQDKVKDIEMERQTLFYKGYSHIVFTESMVGVVGASVEDMAIQAVQISERMSRITKKAERTKKLLEQALKQISKRESIILFVYYRTGLTLTSNKELIEAKNTMIETLERIKEKEDFSIKKKYMQQFQINQNR